jgi:hypothetical protein
MPQWYRPIFGSRQGGGGQMTGDASSSRRAKIVCTLGPANSTPDQVAAGIDLARLNMSHGSQDGHLAVYQRVRAASDASGHTRGAGMTRKSGPELARYVPDGAPGGIRTHTAWFLRPWTLPVGLPGPGQAARGSLGAAPIYLLPVRSWA